MNNLNKDFTQKLIYFLLRKFLQEPVSIKYLLIIINYFNLLIIC